MRRTFKIALGITAAALFIAAGIYIAFELSGRSTQPPGTPTLVLLHEKPGTVTGPVQLASARISPDGKSVLLVFTPDLSPFDPAEIEVRLTFHNKTPDGLGVANVRPLLDWTQWNLPVLGSKPRSLTVNGLDPFDQFTITLSLKGTVTGEWIYARE